MANKRSRNKSLTRANPSRNKSTRANPSSAQTAAAYVAIPSVANTTTAPAPAQRWYAECLLKEFLENYYQWNVEQFKRGCQNILRSLIEKVARLGLENITHGPLTGENILVIGNEAENMKVEILDTPHKYNPAMPSYRKQFRTLASKMVVAWEATCPEASKHFLKMASKHFLKMIEYSIPWFYFKQLQWHPLLLSSNERAMFVIHLYTYLDTERKGWKEDYEKVIPRSNVDFRKTLGGAFGFINVYKYEGVVYKPNALGEFMLYRNVHLHVNGYIYKLHKKNTANRELLEDALLTIEEIENKLTGFFPEVVLELFNYMLHKGIDINAVI